MNILQISRKLPPTLSYKTNERLYSVKIMDDGILKMIKFIRPSPNKIFQCHNPKEIKLVTRLRLGLSHLREHKLKYSFQDTLNPLCSSGLDIETTSHHFLHFPLFHAKKSALLNNINEIDSTIFNKCASAVSWYPATWRRIFQGWSKFAILECNRWFCFVYKQIWWTTLYSLNLRVFFFLFIIIWLQFYNF